MVGESIGIVSVKYVKAAETIVTMGWTISVTTTGYVGNGPSKTKPTFAVKIAQTYSMSHVVADMHDHTLRVCRD